MFAPLAYCLLAVANFTRFALGNIVIEGPSPDAYWIQFTENNITWSYKDGDPDIISIFVTNNNDKSLNGAFSIAEFLNTSIQHFTVTNVTLVLGSGYVVNFAEPRNNSHVYATSQPFEVKPHGTTPANVTVATDLASSTSSKPTASPTIFVDHPLGTAPPDAASRSVVSTGAVVLALGTAALLF